MNIRYVNSSDYSKWIPLWDSYNSFYKRSVSSEVTTKTWERFLNPSEAMYALVAEQNGEILGLVHYLFHRNTAMINDVCYLQDLFTVESSRGQGVGKALILAVQEKAKERGSERVYWQTHETNEVARRLYDKVAENSGFIVYRRIQK